MKRLNYPTICVALVGLFAGCGDDFAPERDAGTSSATDATNQQPSVETSPSEGTSTGGGDATAEDTTSGGSSGTEETGSSETTGEPPSEVAAEMIVHHNDGDAQRFSRSRLLDGELEPPQLLHETDSSDWLSALLFPDRRIVYTTAENGISELRLGSASDPLSGETVALDIPPAGPGTEDLPIAIPGQDAFLYPHNGMVWRVDLTDMGGTPPVALSEILASTGFSNEVAVDPTGRNAVVALPADADGSADVGLLSLTSVSPVQPLHAAGPLETASISGWSADGGGVFVRVEGAETRQVYVDVSGTDPAPPQSVSKESAVEKPEWIRPHLQAHGAVVRSGSNVWDFELSYVGVVDGQPLPPLLLNDPIAVAASPNGLQPWSPDGKHLLIATREGDGAELVLASFSGGHSPIVETLSAHTPVHFSVPGSNIWSADSSALYRTEPDPDGGWTLERWALSDHGVGSSELLAESESRLTVRAVSPDMGTVLFHDAGVLMAVDVSEAAAGTPYVIGGPLEEGASVGTGMFSPDSLFVGYTVQNPLARSTSPTFRLMLVGMEQPRSPVEVSDDVLSFEFVDGWD